MVLIVSSSAKTAPFFFYSRFDAGHRADYMRFLEEKYGASRVGIFGALLARKPVLFLMAEERPVFVIFTMLFRRVFAARTIALLFRLRPLLNSSGAVAHVKRLVLKLLKKSNSFGFVSIVPSDIYPAVSEVCRYNMFDFQFWDCMNDDCDSLLRDSSGMAVLGRQDADKGFPYVSNFLLSFKAISRLAIMGRISSDCKSNLSDILGVIPDADVRNRFVSDTEVLDAYMAYKYVWCCYSPSYDQSSGILGRAIQFGNVPVVRSGSISESYCRILADEYVSVEIENGKPLVFEVCMGLGERAVLQSQSESFLRILLGQ